MKKLNVKGKNILKLKKLTKINKIELGTFYFVLISILLVYFFTKNIFYIVLILAGYLLSVLILNLVLKSKKSMDKISDYYLFYNHFFNNLDLSHNVLESFKDSMNLISGTSFKTKSESYISASQFDEVPPLEYTKTLAELNFLRYLQKGFSKTRVNSSYILKLYELYNRAYFDKKVFN